MAHSRRTSGYLKVALVAVAVVVGFRYVENKTGKSPGSK